MHLETPPCWDGYWRDGDCLPCPPGKSSTGVNVCVPCARGSYWMPSTYGSGTGSGSCNLCPAGTFSDDEESTQCKQCPTGLVASTSGSTYCSYCPTLLYTLDGINCIGDTPTSPPTENCNCGPGFVCNDSRCVPCSRGSYWASYSEGSNFGFCLTCYPGTFSTQEGSTQCKQCPAGTIVSSDRTSCSSCPAPSYTLNNVNCITPEPSRPPSDPCSRCKPGFICENSRCIPCSKGYSWSARSQYGTSVCNFCLPGTFSDEEGLTECKKCPPGTKAAGPYSQFCTSCPEPSYTLDGITCITPEPTRPPTENCNCGPGFYCNDIRCVPCPRGLYWEPYSSGSGSGFCAYCPLGTFTDQEQSTQCKQCPAGTIASTLGSSFCSSCPAPSYTVDNINCIDPISPTSPPTPGYPTSPPTPSPVVLICSSGSVIIEGVCVKCSAGTYEQLGSCIPCKSGTFNMIEGSTSCTPCPGNSVAPGPGRAYCDECPWPAYSPDNINCIFPTRPPTIAPTLAPTRLVTKGSPSRPPKTPSPTPLPTKGLRTKKPTKAPRIRPTRRPRSA